MNWQLLLPALLLKGFQVGPTGRPQYNLLSPVSGFLQAKAMEQLLGKIAPVDPFLMTAQYTPSGIAASSGFSPLSLLALLTLFR